MVRTALGFIGLGRMGGPMVRNLLQAGHPVVVYDVASSAVEQAVAAGAEASPSPGDLASRCRLVFLSVPGKAVEELFYGAEGLLTGLRPGSVVVDFSSTGPELTRRLYADLSAREVELIDAPVSGGPGAARQGTLAIMAGGKKEVFEAVRPYLAVLGRPVRVGGPGSGQVAKLVNNMIVGTNFAIVAEAFAFGVAAGVSPSRLYEAIKDGAADSWVLRAAAPAMMARDFTPGGTVALHERDLQNALDAARALRCPLPVTAVTHELYTAALAAGLGEEAQHALVKLWESLTGARVVDAGFEACM